jgi:hypothetical protein
MHYELLMAFAASARAGLAYTSAKPSRQLGSRIASTPGAGLAQGNELPRRACSNYLTQSCANSGPQKGWYW